MPPTLASARAKPRQAAERRSAAGVLLAAEARRAPVLTELVPRPALVERLATSHDATLALLVAPPGYGKSMLLAQWAANDPRSFLWLGFAEATGGTLTAASRAALGAPGWVDPEALSALGALTTRGMANAATAVVNQARARHRRFVLVLDDAQAFPPEVLRRLAEPLMSLLPDGCTLAVASRTEPGLPIGRLRAHRAVVEVRMDDLAMAPADGASLVRASGVQLDFGAMRALAARTEGWPAALYLAGLSLSGQEDASVAAPRVGGDDHLLAEYIHDEVLSRLTPALTNFALRTSVLEHLTAASCDAVLKEHSSARTLAKLARATELLIPLDPKHEGFRWHGLVRDTLIAELRRAEPDLVPRLHIRAGDWYAKEGATVHAIDHFVAARNVKRTSALLWSRLPSYIAQGRNDMVARWLGSFGEPAIAGSPVLALCAAHSALGRGDGVLAEHWARIAGAPGDAPDPALATGFAVIEATVGHGGAAGMAAAATRACEAEPADSPWRPELLYLRGTAAYLLDDAPAAEALLEEGAGIAAVAAPGVRALCLAGLATIALGRGDCEPAAELADLARDLVADRPGLADCPTSALVLAAAAATGARQRRVDEAKQSLRAATDLLAQLGDYAPWYGALTRVLLAHASLWLADVTAGRALLAEASRLARRVPDAVVFEHWFDEAWEHLDTLAEAALAGPSTLTIAELRILRFLPSHRSFREIAGQLGVSANTVKTQAHAVYRKLGVASRSEAVARATEAGLLGQ